MWTLLILVTLGLAICAAVWGASVLWVRMISHRWDAMCADEDPRKR